MTDARQDIVNWAHWAVKNHGQWNYTEEANRMMGIGHPGILPIWADCSSSVTDYYNWANANDPNGQGYDGLGFTGTLLAHGQHISLGQAIPGDLIVYGGGTGDHTAIIVEAGADPLTVSHGQQGDPNYCRVSWDGRQPQTYLRFDTTCISTPNPAPGFAAAPPNPWLVAEQNFLCFFGYTPASPNLGQFMDGIKKAQRDLHLPQTGVWDATMSVAVQAFLNAFKQPSHHHPVLQAGIKAPQAVSRVQARLKIKVNGLYDAATQAAVVAFQKAHGLQTDGIVGPATWTALGFR